MRALVLSLVLLCGCGVQLPKDQIKAVALEAGLQEVRKECTRQERAMVARAESEDEAKLGVDTIRLGCDAAFLLLKRAFDVE